MPAAVFQIELGARMSAMVENGQEFHAERDVRGPTSVRYSLTCGGVVWNLCGMLSTVILPNFAAPLLEGAGMRVWPRANLVSIDGYFPRSGAMA